MIFPTSFPKQHQDCQPGLEYKMAPSPIYDSPLYNKPNDKLKDKVAIISGGDSGIGRAVSIAFAKSGCDISIIYYMKMMMLLSQRKRLKTKVENAF
ncbi:general stress 39 domain protein [[Clostridium] sordellii ATCC 9714]|nr:general stress 39 domain protein [[Clostridium] sordellii ATCC 9714] [Paeniclostridium sordellii ATCC 9714]